MNSILDEVSAPGGGADLILTIVTGFIYPGVVTALAQLIFNHQANGSLLTMPRGR